MKNLIQRIFFPEDRVLCMNRRNLEFVLPRNPRHHFDLANDKLRAKTALLEAGVPAAETLATFHGFAELKGLQERLSGLSDFVVKPARGSGGRGIVVIASSDKRGLLTASDRRMSWENLRRHVADIVFGVYSFDRNDVAMVEPRLRPSPFFEALYPDGLSDLRIILVDDEPVMAMVRVPTRASEGRANLHQGALGLGVRLQDGIIHRGYLKRRSIETHPDSGMPLTGQQIPQWGTLLDIARRASQAVPLNFLGVDLVVDRSLGPLVLEINVRPGLEIQNVNGVGLRESLRLVEQAR
jgi:alpha-L-glutamate ligase-like protein